MMLLVLQFSVCSLAVTSAYVIQEQGYQWQGDNNRPQYQEGYVYEVPYQYAVPQLPTSASQFSGVNIVPNNDDTYSLGAEEKFSEWNKVRLKGNKSRFKQQFRKRRRNCRHPGHRPQRHRRPHRKENPFVPDNLRGYRRLHEAEPGERITHLDPHADENRGNNIENSRRSGNKNQIRRILNRFATRRLTTSSDEEKHTGEEGDNVLSSDYHGVEKLNLEIETHPLNSEIIYNSNSQGPRNRLINVLQKQRKFLAAHSLRSTLPTRPSSQIIRHTTERIYTSNNNNKYNRIENSAITLHVIPQLLTPPKLDTYPKYSNVLTQNTICKEGKPCKQKEEPHETTTTKYTLLQIAKGTVNVLDRAVKSSTEKPTLHTRFIGRNNHHSYVTFGTPSNEPVKEEFYPIVGYTLPTTPIAVKVHPSENVSRWSEKENVITVTPVASLIVGTPSVSDNVINSQTLHITDRNNSRTVKSLNLHQPRKLQTHQYNSRRKYQHPNINGTRWKPMGLKTGLRASEEVIVGKVHPLIRVHAPSTDNSVNQNLVRISLVDAEPISLQYLPKKHSKREDKPVIGEVEPVVSRRTWIDKNSEDLTAVVSSHIVVQ